MYTVKKVRSQCRILVLLQPINGICEPYQVTKVGLQGELLWLSWQLAEELLTQQGHSVSCRLKADETGTAMSPAGFGKWSSPYAPFVLYLLSSFCTEVDVTLGSFKQMFPPKWKCVHADDSVNDRPSR